MSYEVALKIVDVINDIHKKNYLLPAIQREFVWDTDQIEKLFDSLMRNYPIGSFLFWKVEKENVKKDRLRNFLEAQLEEIYRYKWIMGEEMHNDPLNNYSMNDICFMWILNNAKEFRNEWVHDHGSGYFDGVDNPN